MKAPSRQAGESQIPAVVLAGRDLSTLSPAFRAHWAAQDVHEHRTGRKLFHHAEVGDLEADYDVLDVPGEPGISITSYTAPAGSATTEKFALLASWAASQNLTAIPRADAVR